MIIQKIHVENFGTLNNVDIVMNENLNEICHENGWGKSTFGAFLKAMFYGMSAKARGNALNYERSKFSPWQGGNYGGYVEFLYQNQPYRLTRYFGKTPEGDSQELMNLSTMKISPNPTSEIGEVIFGVGRETFEITAYFPQLNFMPAENGEVRAGLTGANKFQDDQSNFERAIKIIDLKITQTKKQLYKKEEIERTKISLGQNVAYQNVKNNEHEKLSHEIKSRQEEISSKQQVLKLIQSKNDLLQTQLDRKRTLEGKLQFQTQTLNKTLLEKEEEERSIRERKPSKKPLLITAIIVLCFVGVFGGLCAVSPLVGGIGLALSICAGGGIMGWIGLKKAPVQSLSRDYEGEIKQITQDIEQIKKELESYSYNAQDLEDNSSLVSEINAMKVDIATKKAHFENLGREISRLENEEEEINYNLHKMMQNNEQTDKNLEILIKAKEFMTLAQQNVSQRFVSPLNNHFKEFLQEFNLIDRDFVVDSNLEIKQNTNFGQKELGYSSQGIKDILSFCQRINLATKIFKKEKPFILLDDTFVNLDDQKLEIAKKLVKSISKDFQIIYICCNSRCKIEE